jgi:hypothetical protein
MVLNNHIITACGQGQLRNLIIHLTFLTNQLIVKFSH